MYVLCSANSLRHIGPITGGIIFIIIALLFVVFGVLFGFWLKKRYDYDYCHMYTIFIGCTYSIEKRTESVIKKAIPSCLIHRS